MAKEQKPTIQSPLEILVKPLVVGQHTLPGLERFAPRDESRFSIPRIAYTLRRAKNSIQAFISRDGRRGHLLKTAHPSSSSTLAWTEGDNQKLTVSAELPGEVNMAVDNGALVFTNETGATVRFHASGSILFSPVPLRRQRLAEEQAELPWWQQEKEVIHNKRIAIAATVASEPEFGQSTNNNTPYGRMKIRVEGTETLFDVYAYQQGVPLLKKRKLHKDDLIQLEASVHVEPQFQPGRQVGERRWLRYFNSQKLPG